MMIKETLIGKVVSHPLFGNGVISKLTERHIFVSFHDQEKEFSYPDAIGKYLTLEDSNLQEQIVSSQKEPVKKSKKPTSTLSQQSDSHKKSKRHTHGKKFSEQIFPKHFNNVSDFCTAYIAALEREMVYVKANNSKYQRLSNGKYIKKSGNQYSYLFESDSELNYPAGIEINIKQQNGQKNKGSIINCREFSVALVSEEDLGSAPSSIEISGDPWRLIKSLIDRIANIKNQASSQIVLSLISDGKYQLNDYPLKFGQKTAIDMTLSQPITFIWGPPGTGKTETLAQIALAHIKKGERVLMLSYSNVSVDEASKRVLERDTAYTPGKLLRYGYPRNKDVLYHKTLTSYNYIIQRYLELIERQNAIQSEIDGMSFGEKASVRYLNLTKELQDIKNRLNAEEKNAVRNAKFVATTVSKAVVDKTIYEDDDYDVVIFDEASMAYVPQIIFSSSLARKHFVCLGDFNQLPPIVQSTDTSILLNDIFSYCGITDAISAKRNHAWLCILNTQYRMHPQVANYVSERMYQSFLCSGATMGEARKDIINHAPFIGMPITFVDLSGMMTVCTNLSDHSHINPLSAFIAIGLAFNAARTNEVGIITPYTAQSRLLNAMARDIAKNAPELKTITCATVHQFQGSEKDVIIYDAVDCYIQKYPGILLTSLENNYANRLFNVAMTRAKGKFISIANIDYMRAKKISEKLLFSNLIAYCNNNKLIINGSDLPKELSKTTANYQYFSAKDGIIALLKDLEEASGTVRIDIPMPMTSDEKTINQFCAAIEKCRKRGVKVQIRTNDKSLLPARLQTFTAQKKLVHNSISIIDKTIIWFGMPPSNACFQTAGGQIPTHYRPIIRFKGSYTATALIGFLELDKTLDESEATPTSQTSTTFAQFVKTHCKCPICGSSLNIKKSKKTGRFFLSCTDHPQCTYTEKITIELVEKYLHFNSTDKVGLRCPHCNFSLEACRGSYGIYVRCCGLEQHSFSLDKI